MARQGDVPVSVYTNKVDQGLTPDMEDRLAVYEELGLTTGRVSALTGEGVAELDDHIRGKTVAFFGQSGVGKSTLLNALEPGLNLKTGDISRKYDRGRHTTNYSVLIDRGDRGRLIDTPGIREIFIWGLEPEELEAHFPEFSRGEGTCGFQPCTHRHEPDCVIRRLVEEGRIHPDRYESYLRIREDLEERSLRLRRRESRRKR